jgi:tRNA threonylcarbamoyladenosine biosynthesis protein TsaB
MLLAIDTATDQASVALGAPGSEPLEENLAGARRHASALLPMIEGLLRQASASLDSIRGIVLSDGPGSFTGLRVGAAAAKALVQARHLPLWIAPSLLVRAAGVAQDEQCVLAVSSALRGELYAAAYRFRGDEIQTVLIPSVRRPDQLMAGSIVPDRIVGEAPPEILAALGAWAGQQVIGPPRGAPHAAQLLRLVGRSGGARQVQPVSEWEPVYGRPAEAQARWEIAHGRPLPDSVGSPR